MKKTILYILFTIWPFLSYSQSENKYKVFVDFGYKTTLIDFQINGPVFGLSIYSPNRKLSLNLRNDILFEIGKRSYVPDTTGLVIKSEKYEIIDYRTQNYIECDYKFDLGKHKLFTGLGIGWRYLGDDKNYRFNRDYGYLTFSTSVKYNIDWFILELRWDIPLRDDYYRKYNGTYRLFPVTFALYYRFRPKKIE